jgi:hypothetical protein
VVGAKGFEPSTSWSRTKYLRDEKCYFPLLVVRNLYLEF